MDNVIRGGNWWFDTINTWIVLDEVRLPDVARKKEAFTPGGGNWEVEWPEEFQAMTAGIKLKNNDPRIRGLCGREPGSWITSYYYEHLRSYRNGEEKGRIVVLKGLLNAIKDDPKKAMKATGIDYEFSTIVFYHDMFAGRSIHKLDFFSGPAATIVNGDRPFAGMARNLRLGGGT